MAVESEVSVELAASIQENSCQDLVKPDCSLVKHVDQANGLDNSHVLVGDDNVEKLVVVEDSRVESKLVVELRNGDSDVLFDGSVEERENGNVEERNGGSESGVECEVLIVNGSRDGSVENEENVVVVEDSHDESVPVVEFRDGNSDVLAVEERENGNVEEWKGEIVSGAECEALFVNGSCDGRVENEENAVGVVDSCDESVPVVEFQDGNSDVLSVEEEESGNAEERNGEIESGAEWEVPLVNGFPDGSVENEENGFGVEGSRVESVSVVEFRDGNSDVLLVEEGARGNGEEQNGEIESGAECDVPLVEVDNGKFESLARVGIKMNGDQEGNFEVVTETEQEKGKEFIMENGNPAAVENPGTRVEEVALVADSVEKVELNDLSSGNGSDNVDGECEDQNNGVYETSEVYNGSSHLVSSAIGNELEEEIAEAQDEAPLVTSMEPDLDIHPINNDKILREKEELDNFSSHQKADNAAGECENQIISNETLSVNTGSSDVVVDAVESGLQEASTDGQIKAELEGEVIECPELELPVSISVDAGPESFAIDEEKMLKENGESKKLLSCDNESNDAAECEVTLVKSVDSNVDSCPINSEDTLEKEAKTTVAFDVIENQKWVAEVTSSVSSTDQHVETVGELVSHEKNTVCISVSDVEDTVQYHEEPEKHLDVSEASHVPMQFESEKEDSLPTQSLPISHVNKPHSKINMSGAETLEVVSSAPANGPKAESVENNTSIEPDSNLDTVVCSEKEPAFRSGDKQDETEVSSGKGKLVHVPSATVNTKLDHAKARTSFSVTYKKDLLESFNINREAASNITWGSAKIKFGTANVEDTGDKSDVNSVISDGNLMLKENEHTEICKNGSVSMASSGTDGSGSMANVEDTGDKSDVNSVISDGNLMLKENEHTEICKNGSVSMASSGTDEVCGEELSFKPATNPFHYLVRVPRFDDEILKERIKLQEIQLDDWTQQRDAIQVLIQETRKAIDQSHGVNYENAKNHVSSAWKLVRAKRVEMDSLQPTLNTVKSAASIQDIDQRICRMEYMIQHESMPLKKEKQLIHEIKQQKQLRKQLSSNIGSHDEIKESLEQLETVEERMKILKKEHEILKGNAEKAETAFVEAKGKYDDEYKKVKELQPRYRVVNDSRQEAYNQLKSLRKELKEKNKHFYKYKDDATAAHNHARSNDRDALHSQCKNQVEKFMELWNNNDMFRKEYVTFSAKSTVRRFGTLDGRALGPKEERPVIPSYVDQKVHKLVSTPAKIDSVSKTPVLELKQEIKLENRISEEKTNKKLTKSKGKASAKDKEAAEPGLTTVSSKNVSEEVQVEVEPTKSKEEIELERKAEEMRRREDEIKLKEQLRLEEIAKAQEARERKKRKEEREKRRAELRARKEAEQKEKEREKRLRKKEKKNASTAVTAESSKSIIDPAPMPENIIETAQEIEPPKEASTTKKPQRPVFTKRNKPRVIQSPPQIRRKRNWMRNPWVIMTVIIAAISIIMTVIIRFKYAG